MPNRVLFASAVRCLTALLLAVTTHLQQLASSGTLPGPANATQSRVWLQCTPGGGVAGTVKITNTSPVTIPAHTTIYLANFGGNANALLPECLPSSAARQVVGPPGAFRTCQAWFYQTTSY